MPCLGAPRLDDVKQSLEDVKAQKYIILCEEPLSSDEMGDLYYVCSEVQELNRHMLVKSLADLMAACTFLLINVTNADFFRWYQDNKNWVTGRQNVTLIYKHRRGVPISDMEQVKKNFAADHVRKTLPTTAESLADYISKLTNDHISSSAVSDSRCTRILKKLASCVVGTSDD